MAANMIGVKKNIIIVNMGLIDVVMFNPVIISRRGRYETEGMPMYVTYSDLIQIALFYFLLAFSHCIAAVLRGSGHAAVPMIVMLCVWCMFRVSYITVAVHYIPDIRVIFWAYPLTWSISSGIFLYLFLRGKWVYGFEKKR